MELVQLHRTTIIMIFVWYLLISDKKLFVMILNVFYSNLSLTNNMI